MPPFHGFHHIALICSDYAVSRDFYTRILGLPIIGEHFRKERNSYKLDLQLPDGGQIELFSFPSPPERPSRPEACGLRHIAFRTENIDESVCYLEQQGVRCEEIRTDEFTGSRFTFFADPDNQPVELYEMQ